MNTIRRCHSFQEKPNKNLYLEASINGRVNQIEIPQYALRYANFDRVSLPIAKQEIYHPQLSSLYKYQIDNFANKFTIENSRTSTNLLPEHFIHDKSSNQNAFQKVSHPIRLVGDLENAQHLLKKRSQSADFVRHATPEKDPSIRPVSCIAGKEEHYKPINSKVERVFRFNRVREVLPERPKDGRKQFFFDTTPVLDKVGRRVEAATASKFRQSQSPMIVNAKEPFKPYGFTTGHYKNYIMYYPKM